MKIYEKTKANAVDIYFWRAEVDECNGEDGWKLVARCAEIGKFKSVWGVAEHDFGDLDIATYGTSDINKVREALLQMSGRGIDEARMHSEVDGNWIDFRFFIPENGPTYVEVESESEKINAAVMNKIASFFSGNMA